ncbi:MAG: DegQ family serine endoprotease [Syntrophales bacterium]|nr:DegQ family serine endoprotease [Syntrophales bacterium]
MAACILGKKRAYLALFFILIWSMVFVTFSDAAPSRISSAPASLADLVEKLSPSVVNISTTQTVKPNSGSQGNLPFRFFGNDEFMQRFFGGMPEREFKQRSLGSGFIISKDGYIVTNNHVVAKADKIKVKLANGKEYNADIKGRDPNTDLALIKIEANGNLPAVNFGDSDKLRVGDWVFAIGNPYGLEHTVTAGIVSAKGRALGSGPYDNFIQTDASINPGNSGGPLFNLDGEVVGINTAIVAQAQGIGFSVPANMANIILTDLKTKGSVTRGWLGISIQDITDDMAENLKLNDKKGALVNQVFEGDPADRAGIKTGDIIISINDHFVQDTHDLLRTVAALPVGKQVEVKILREGSEQKLSLVVGERKEGREFGMKEKLKDFLGMSVQEITSDMAKHFGPPIKGGVIITDIREGSPADEGGLKPQDIILEINSVKIKSLRDFANETARRVNDKSLRFLIKREDHTLFVIVRNRP